MIGASRKKTYELKSFPQPLPNSFRENMKQLLEEFCEQEDYQIQNLDIWCISLTHHTKTLPLYIVEEVIDNSSLKPNCEHCRYAGWSRHHVSKRKYHFIIPIDNEWDKPIQDGVLDPQSHILHGLIHCNGFGHLICINGIEGGSNFICGREVMDLWDRICTSLRSREISLVDNSKKRNMDLRLLYGISSGSTWFGRWDYKFCHGSFGVTKDTYEQALQILSTLELDVTIQDSNIKELISKYRAHANTTLITVKDLFAFMLQFRFPTTVDEEKYESFATVAEQSKSKYTVTCGKYNR